MNMVKRRPILDQYWDLKTIVEQFLSQREAAAWIARIFQHNDRKKILDRCVCRINQAQAQFSHDILCWLKLSEQSEKKTWIFKRVFLKLASN